MGITESSVGDLWIDESNYSSLFLYLDFNQLYGNRAYKERLLWTLTDTPDFVNEEYLDGYDFIPSFINIPLYTRLGNCTVDEVFY